MKELIVVPTSTFECSLSSRRAFEVEVGRECNDHIEPLVSDGLNVSQVIVVGGEWRISGY